MVPPISSTPRKFAQLVNHAMRGLWIGLGCIGIGESRNNPGSIPRWRTACRGKFQNRGTLCSRRELDGVNHALEAAPFAEAAGNEDAIVALEAFFQRFSRESISFGFRSNRLLFCDGERGPPCKRASRKLL